MSYQPVVPFSGYSGWIVLQNTEEMQRETFNASAEVTRTTDYFKENIGNVSSVEDLMADRELLSVALGAFGLEDDIDNSYFIQKVLEEGTLDEDSLANKLSDTRYFELAEAFGFGDFDTPNTVLSTFGDEIVDLYQDRQFEVAVGEQNTSMRLALSMERELAALAESDTTDNGRWYSVMGNEAVREVFETAFGLPSTLGANDLDVQLKEFRKKAEQYMDDGEVSQFSDPAKRDELVKLYLLKAEIEAGTSFMTPASAALVLLGG